MATQRLTDNVSSWIKQGIMEDPFLKDERVTFDLMVVAMPPMNGQQSPAKLVAMFSMPGVLLGSMLYAQTMLDNIWTMTESNTKEWAAEVVRQLTEQRAASANMGPDSSGQSLSNALLKRSGTPGSNGAVPHLESD